MPTVELMFFWGLHLVFVYYKVFQFGQVKTQMILSCTACDSGKVCPLLSGVPPSSGVPLLCICRSIVECFHIFLCWTIEPFVCEAHSSQITSLTKWSHLGWLKRQSLSPWLIATAWFSWTCAMTSKQLAEANTELISSAFSMSEITALCCLVQCWKMIVSCFVQFSSC